MHVEDLDAPDRLTECSSTSSSIVVPYATAARKGLYFRLHVNRSSAAYTEGTFAPSQFDANESVAWNQKIQKAANEEYLNYDKVISPESQNFVDEKLELEYQRELADSQRLVSIVVMAMTTFYFIIGGFRAYFFEHKPNLQSSVRWLTAATFLFSFLKLFWAIDFMKQYRILHPLSMIVVALSSAIERFPSGHGTPGQNFFFINLVYMLVMRWNFRISLIISVMMLLILSVQTWIMEGPITMYRIATPTIICCIMTSMLSRDLDLRNRRSFYMKRFIRLKHERLQEDKATKIIILENVYPKPLLKDMLKEGQNGRHFYTVKRATVIAIRLSPKKPYSRVDEFDLKVLSSLYEMVYEIFELHNIHRLKTMGGVVAGISGLFEADMECELTVSKCATEFQKKFHSFALFADKHNYSIGIGSGKVFGGILVNSHKTFDIFGEGLDRALTCLKYASSGSVVVDDTTRRVVKGLFNMVPTHRECEDERQIPYMLVAADTETQGFKKSISFIENKTVSDGSEDEDSHQMDDIGRHVYKNIFLDYWFQNELEESRYQESQSSGTHLIHAKFGLVFLCLSILTSGIVDIIMFPPETPFSSSPAAVGVFARFFVLLPIIIGNTMVYLVYAEQSPKALSRMPKLSVHIYGLYLFLRLFLLSTVLDWEGNEYETYGRFIPNEFYSWMSFLFYSSSITFRSSVANLLGWTGIMIMYYFAFGSHVGLGSVVFQILEIAMFTVTPLILIYIGLIGREEVGRSEYMSYTILSKKVEEAMNEKELLDDTIRSVLPRNVYDNGNSRPAAYEIVPDATLILLSFIGATTQEFDDDIQSIEVISDIYQKVEEITALHELEIFKTVGLCCWILATPKHENDNHTERAVQFAFHVRALFSTWDATFILDDWLLILT
eukprot:TRINITY_DN10659_c0_g1_i1.p1 TRINITY_DN10659_c0_g1~~TRINITY_DN10659_c0_g1_i1.p1  ORF type:complete len:895 (+),score=161.35 TRINITY_DN10659_c0_g1_i1:40-2724(+)